MKEETAQQEKPCIHTWETGKHEWNTLHWKHQASENLFYWIPTCPSCGWIDTLGMVRELSFWKRLRVLFLMF
jgi:hypothetical protein